MSALLLIALLVAGFSVQYYLDTRAIADEALDRGWSGTGISWAPFGRGWMMRSRKVRSYWLRYFDERGKPDSCLVLVSGQRFIGSFDVEFDRSDSSILESISLARKSAARGEPLDASTRLASIVVWTFLGLWAGAALGIGVCFLIYPGSNVAPAYGVIYGAPLGLAAGAAFGALRRRR